MRLLSLDPSINNVGFCLFDSKIKHTVKQWQHGTWHLTGGNRTIRLVDLRDLVNELGPVDHLIVEYPSFFSSERGQIAAHQNYTIDLACICGYIAGCLGMDQRSWHCLTAMKWKGTVSKEITLRKFMRIFKPTSQELRNISEHAIDAIMIMNYFLRTYGEAIFEAAGLPFPNSPLLRF